jgi:serine/threonine protein kinase
LTKRSETRPYDKHQPESCLASDGIAYTLESVLTPEARQQLTEIFACALELPADERATYLDCECAGKPELRRQIEDLLVHSQPEDDLLERPAWEGIATIGSIDGEEVSGPFPPIALRDASLEKVFRSLDTRLESLPGSVLDQKYRIERPLGKGAMGAVFQATHLGTMRTVALKVIVPKLAEHAEFSQRFKREAEAAGRLRHINVVNVTDFGITRVHDTELAYLVMEYLDGQTLSSHLKSEPLPPFHFVTDIIEQTALALDAAHVVGVVHRDLKPSNIWLEPNHRGGYTVKVLDFGIAKVTGQGDAVPRATTPHEVEQTPMARADLQVAISADSETMPGLLSAPSSLMTTVGTLLGTPAYMAPEQCQGLDIDGRADIYSLAVIAYEMLCGRRPFASEDYRQLVRMQIHDTPQSPRERDPSVPRALADIVLNGLDKDPAHRPPSAGAFATKLRAVTEGELTLLRKSREVFHTHTNYLLPLLIICLLPVPALLIPLRWLARFAFAAKLAPAWFLILGVGLSGVALVLFAIQLYKVACLLVIEGARGSGDFRLSLRSIVSYLLRGLPAMLRTQLRSTLDLRPASFRDNLLWPIIWVKEQRTGKQAIDRSRELCRTLPEASTALMVRQYGPPVMGLLWIPFFLILVLAKERNVLSDLFSEVLSGSSFRGFSFTPLIFVMYYQFIGSSYALLYGSALRCRGEGGEIALPSLSRGSNRSGSSFAMRPATFLWAAAPTAMLAAILVKAIF